eukprot:SAG31_NODE_3049_length_4745_cov_3.873870_3_plen_261_part_00
MIHWHERTVSQHAVPSPTQGDLVRNLEVSDQVVPPALLAFARENPKFVQRQARHAADRSGLGFGGGGKASGSHGAKKAGNLGGLGYRGSHAGKMADHKGENAGSVKAFGLDFQAASEGPVVAEGGGFIPSKRAQQAQKHTVAAPDGFASARDVGSDEAFTIGEGGLVASKAVQQKASQFLNGEGLGAHQLGLAATPTTNLASDWIAAAAGTKLVDNVVAESSIAPPAHDPDDWLSAARKQGNAAPASATSAEKKRRRWDS